MQAIGQCVRIQTFLPENHFCVPDYLKLQCRRVGEAIARKSPSTGKYIERQNAACGLTPPPGLKQHRGVAGTSPREVMQRLPAHTCGTSVAGDPVARLSCRWSQIGIVQVSNRLQHRFQWALQGSRFRRGTGGQPPAHPFAFNVANALSKMNVGVGFRQTIHARHGGDFAPRALSNRSRPPPSYQSVKVGAKFRR